jgi:hypothetical protein
MFIKVDTKSELVKTILSDEAFWVEGEEFVEVKYLVKGESCNLNKTQTKERNIKWKKRTRRKMKEGKRVRIRKKICL